jgi:hypothetical protein
MRASSTVSPKPTYSVPESTVELRSSGCVWGGMRPPGASLTRSR